MSKTLRYSNLASSQTRSCGLFTGGGQSSCTYVTSRTFTKGGLHYSRLSSKPFRCLSGSTQSWRNTDTLTSEEGWTYYSKRVFTINPKGSWEISTVWWMLSCRGTQMFSPKDVIPLWGIYLCVTASLWKAISFSFKLVTSGHDSASYETHWWSVVFSFSFISIFHWSSVTLNQHTVKMTWNHKNNVSLFSVGEVESGLKTIL